MKKNTFLFALLMPAMLFGQQDTAKSFHITKPKKCNVTIAGKYHALDTIPIAELTTITVDCGTILGFNMAYSTKGTYRNMQIRVSNNYFLLGDLANEMKGNPDYSPLTISNIKYKDSKGGIHYIQGITVRIKQ